MVSKHCFHNRTLTDIMCKNKVIKFRHHLAGINIVVNPAVLSACIVRIFTTESVEIRTVFDCKLNAVR